MSTTDVQPTHNDLDDHTPGGGLEQDLSIAQVQTESHSQSGDVEQALQAPIDHPLAKPDTVPGESIDAAMAIAESAPQSAHLLIDGQTCNGGLGGQGQDGSQILNDPQSAHAPTDGHVSFGGLEGGSASRAGTIATAVTAPPVQASTNSHCQDSGGAPTREPKAITVTATPAHTSFDGQAAASEGASSTEADANSDPAHPRISYPSPHPELADPLLSFLAAIVDDLEEMRKANENRLRQLTRTEVDKDGEVRGFGLTEAEPAVARQIGIVAGINKLERDAVKNLEDRTANHPLAVFAQQRGVGLKSLARLLASIGDPFWNSLAGETRGLRQLWAFSGLHNVPVAHTLFDSYGRSGGEDPTQTRLDSHGATGGNGVAGGDQGMRDSQGLYVAARRTRGQKSNWSSTAKSRAYLIAETMLKSGNREAYDARKAATEGKLHAAPCIQCGKKGKPAEVGTPWRDGHRHADAMRVVSKNQVLRPLWELAREIHNSSDSSNPGTNSQFAIGESDQSSGSSMIKTNSQD